MRTSSLNARPPSVARLFEMLTDRFGVFEAIATTSITLSRHVAPDELAMDPKVAEAILEFGDDLRQAAEAAAHTSG